MKGLIFMIVVTLLVLASFARPEKENSNPDVQTIHKTVNTANNPISADSNSIHYKKG